MSPRASLSRTKRLYLRLDKPAQEHVDNQLKSGAFKSQNDYVLWLIKQHRDGRDTPMSELAETIGNTIDQFRKDIRGDIFSARKSAELSNAFLHAVVKMMLVNIPEADGETRKIATATAKKRYETLLINAVKEYEDERQKEDEGDDE